MADAWLLLPDALRLARARFGAAVAKLAGVSEAVLSEELAVGVLRGLAEAGKIRVAVRSPTSLSANDVTALDPRDRALRDVTWVQAGKCHGFLVRAGESVPVLLHRAELVLALSEAMPSEPEPQAEPVPGVEFLPDGRAVADMDAAMRLVEKHRAAWGWIASPVRNVNFAERKFPATPAAMLAALFDPSEPGFARLFGRLAGGWTELDWSARPVIADAAGRPVGMVTVRDAVANMTMTVEVGFPIIQLAHHLDALSAEAEQRARRLRGPSPAELARLAAEREAKAKAEAEEAAKRRKAEEVLSALAERERQAREARARAAVAALIPMPPAPEPVTAAKLARA